MLAPQKCCQCLLYFNMVRLPRKLPSCPHSICETCLREIIDTKQEIIICGFCSAILKKAEIRIFPLNTTLLMTLSETPSNHSHQTTHQEEENQLLAEASSFTASANLKENEQELCPEHKVSMDIVCVTDKQKICPHCALFGKHKDHRIRRLEDFQKEILEKRKIFKQILNEKEIFSSKGGFGVYQRMKRELQLKQAQLRNTIEQQARLCVASIQKAKEKAFQQVQVVCNEFQQCFPASSVLSKFQKSKIKLEKWQKNCVLAIQQIEMSSKVEEKLAFYYEGPLEIVTEGFVFLEELNRHSQQSQKKLAEKIQEIQLVKEELSDICFEKYFNIKRAEISIRQEAKLIEEESEINPFLDCTASEITAGHSTFLNNSSFEADISKISRQVKVNKPESRLSLPRKQPQLKAVRSVDKDPSRISIQTKQSLSPKGTPKRLTSEATNFNFSPKMQKCTTTKDIMPEVQSREDIKPFELRQAQKLYQKFIKNTLTDFFDLSECGLSSEKLVEYVHRAKRLHRIKGMKLTRNCLTSSGFLKMTEHLQGVSNINLASNNINEEIFDVVLSNRDKLDALKMLNISHNPITLDKKAANRLEELKKYGIIVIL